MSIDSCDTHTTSSGSVEPGHDVCIDLRIPSFTPFSAAYDLLQFLQPADVETRVEELFEPVIHLDMFDVTNVWYGLESLGNIDQIKAKAAALAVQSCMPRRCRLTIRCGDYVSQENLAFLWYLLQAVDAEIVFLSEGVGLSQYCVDFIETLRNSQTSGQFEDFHFSAPSLGHTLRKRRSPVCASELCGSDFVRFLVSRKRLPPYCGEDSLNDYFVRCVWQILACGATDLAVQILATVTCDDPEFFLEGTLMGLQRFKDLDNAVDPQVHKSGGSLPLFMKGYAALLQKESQQASALFTRAAIKEDMVPREPQDLYKLNALSLLLFRDGEITKAYAIQKSISYYVETTADLCGTNIHYTNQLNLGRLSRSQKDYDAALSHFDSAFKQIEGVKTLSDHLYSAVLAADLLQAKGAVQHAAQKWFQAALFWCALPCKNAVNWRVQGSILKSTSAVEGLSSSSQICQAMLSKLERFVAEGALRHVPIRGTTTIRELGVTPFADAVYLSTNLFSGVIASCNEGFTDPFETTPVFHSLTGLVVSILQAETQGFDILSNSGLFLDLDGGIGMPRHLRQALLRCTRLGVPFLSNGTYSTPPEIVRNLIRVEAHPAILRIEETQAGGTAFYKRHYGPAGIGFHQFLLLRLLRENPAERFTAGSLSRIFPGLDDAYLSELEHRKLVYLAALDGPAEEERPFPALQ